MTRVAAIFLLVLSATGSAQKADSDSAIKQQMIRESIGSYPGNCPCPYNTDRAGRSCGRRSAYNRAGGYAPLCYAEDISADMVAEFKRRQSGK